MLTNASPELEVELAARFSGVIRTGGGRDTSRSVPSAITSSFSAAAAREKPRALRKSSTSRSRGDSAIVAVVVGAQASQGGEGNGISETGKREEGYAGTRATRKKDMVLKNKGSDSSR